MRRIDNPLTTEGKDSKNKNSRRGKSFGYQVLGFGSGGAGGPFIVASGGTPACGTIDGDFKYHTFNGPGTFCVTAGTCVANNDVAYMVVGGAGAGGFGVGGGGGAGGFREGKNNCLTPYTASPLVAGTGITVTSQGYPITVGGGSAGGTATQAAPLLNGNLSTFSTITSAGGGGGGSHQSNQIGGSGGSGGGGTYTWSGVHVSIPAPASFKGAGDTPNVTPDQGFPGGKGWDVWYSGILAGGGGGATSAGACATSSGPGGGATGSGGPGGTGTSTSITGASVAYAGGGGGTAYGIHLGSINPGNSGAASPCGTGKAAAGPSVPARDGTTNRGGGGGAGGGPGPDCSGAGGSGIVVIRYKFQ